MGSGLVSCLGPCPIQHLIFRPQRNPQAEAGPRQEGERRERERERETGQNRTESLKQIKKVTAVVDADRNRDREGRNGDREEELGEEGGHTDRRGYETGMHTKTLEKAWYPQVR